MRWQASAGLHLLLSLCVLGCGDTPEQTRLETTRMALEDVWTGSWSVAPQASGDTFGQQTLRQIIHPTLSGRRVRVQLSNAFGASPLHISHVHIARRAQDAAIVADSDRVLLFAGNDAVSIEVGQAVTSDALDFQVNAFEDLSVSFFLPEGSGAATFHQQGSQDNYLVDGDQTSAQNLNGLQTRGSYYFLTNLDVVADGAWGSVVTLGASITDGVASSQNQNRRWPNDLSVRLSAANMPVGVLNQGISGNRLLADGAGESALHRFERDVLSQANVRWVIFSDDPINDLGGGNPGADELISAASMLIQTAHERGIRFFCSTLTPYEGSGGWRDTGEAVRGKYNEFVRSAASGCDGIIDQDQATHDPQKPTWFLPANDWGDHLHPNETGLQAIADAVPLTLFTAPLEPDAGMAAEAGMPEPMLDAGGPPKSREADAGAGMSHGQVELDGGQVDSDADSASGAKARSGCSVAAHPRTCAGMALTLLCMLALMVARRVRTGGLLSALLAMLMGCNSTGSETHEKLDASSRQPPPADGGTRFNDSGSSADDADGGDTTPEVDAAIPSVPDGPTGAAFDVRRGVLNVDHEHYLAQHDIIYRTPNDNPLYGLTVGNGKVGAMVWNQDGLTMQVSGVDASEQAAFAGGLVHFDTAPALTAGENDFEQRLSLYDGTLSTRYQGGVRVTILGVAGSEMLGIHVEDPRSEATGATLELSLWDVSNLQNSGAVPNLDTWKQVTSFADDHAAGLSRGQDDPHDFGYTLAATVEAASFTSERVNDGLVRLHIAASHSYTIWLACSSRLNAPNHDSVAAAQASLATTATLGYEQVQKSYLDFWHAFWKRSFVQYSGNQDADYFENFYYLASYVIAAGSHGNYPFHFINGVFRATHDDTKWSNAYWYWNQRDVYASFLASNHPEVMDVWNRMYYRNMPALEDFTHARYGGGGLWLPETMGWDGDASGTIYSDYTKNILSTGTEAALNIHAYYLHTGDDTFLRETAYPFMRDVANFYVQRFSFDAGSQHYVMQNSNAHETYWNVRNAITDLAAVRALFPGLIALSSELGRDEPARKTWQDLLDRLQPYPEDNGTYAPHEPPISDTRNNENVVCELIWPYSVTGIGAADYDKALQAFRTRPFPYGNVWANDAIQAARLGLADELEHGLKTMLQRYQRYPNGFTDNTNGVFEYWGVHLTALQEALLQSHGGKLRVFPAVPRDATRITRFTLHAEGGFLVSAEGEGGETKYVGLKSELGRSVTLVNPWPGQTVSVHEAKSDAALLSAQADELSFATEPGKVYVVERADHPLSRYDYAHITSAAMAGPRALSDGSASLGLDRPLP